MYFQLIYKGLYKKMIRITYHNFISIMAKVYNFDTKRLPLGSNRLLPKSNRLPLVFI